MKIFKCKECNEFIFSKRNVDLTKADKKLEELIPNTKEDGYLKHLPLYELKNNELKVYVGEIMHPMDDKHYIAWILVETSKGVYKVELKNNESYHIFHLDDNEEIYKIYAYCNLHGLWMNKVKEL